VHPTLPAFLTSSDDTLIKLWDWDKGFSCVQQFEGHSHFVMQVSEHKLPNYCSRSFTQTAGSCTAGAQGRVLLFKLTTYLSAWIRETGATSAIV